MSRNPIYDQPTPEERAAFDRRQRERLERVRRPGPVETWITDTVSAAFNPSVRPDGRTSFSDAQMAERRRQEAARAQAETDAVLARRQRDNEELLANLARSNQRAGRPLTPQLEAALAASNARRGTSSSAETTRTSPSASGSDSGNDTRSSSSSSSASQEKSAAERSSDLRANNVTFRTASTQLYDSSVANSASSVTRMGRDVFSISRFRANVSESDAVLPTHSFLVTFAPMDWISSRALSEDIMSSLTMRCDNVILPSINLLQEQNIRRYGYGPVENVPYGVNVGDFTLQFIVDKSAAIVDFFEAWLNRIVNRDSYGGADMNSDSDARYQSYKVKPYEVAYKDTYACSSVNVFIYDRAQNTVLEYNIYDVFPTGIQSMNMSWSEENNLMRLNVTFSFTDLRIRPKISAFGQAAGQRNGIDTNPLNSLPSVPVTVAGLPDVPLVDPNSIIIPTDLVPPVTVIGDGDNAALRTFGTPEDTAPVTADTPEVPTPTTRDTFGQPFTVA